MWWRCRRCRPPTWTATARPRLSCSSRACVGTPRGRWGPRRERRRRRRRRRRATRWWRMCGRRRPPAARRRPTRAPTPRPTLPSSSCATAPLSTAPGRWRGCPFGAPAWGGTSSPPPPRCASRRPTGAAAAPRAPAAGGACASPSARRTSSRRPRRRRRRSGAPNCGRLWTL
ncbi:hypothetical protein BU14_0052s0075 [Porphyra umbilicalis]|uniref:Uncharacterized protein n=1 Tax=Porphyra umbilicalis TaxID=2786 RepID=A0A1X6PHY3_PORUM|nr:hypothetical protein BU14_0052s0075 [Porphyra umbilicalis]|eukprot:OSX80462.1 hypothetical protein BU14_0052s0075 [Porphyra umbilicalis]